MKINKKLTISVLTVAVQSTLMIQAAEAARNTIDIGGVGVTHQSAKFGEYSGLNESNFNGGFDFGGGDAYEGTGGIRSWEMSGTDVGTTSRAFKGAMSEQGKWKLSIGRDELRHNVSDSYQTPLIGTMGSNIFTLPGNFGTTNGKANAYPGATGIRTLTDAQKKAFHTEKVGSNRYNTSFGAGFDFTEHLKLNFGYNHLEQTGAKLLAVSSQGGEATPTVLIDTWNKESVSIIMNPTKYKTDTFDLALNWMGENAHLTASYFGSVFRDGFNSVSWENNIYTGSTTLNNGACISTASCGYQTGAMSTAPNNDFHQLNLIGGYDFAANTKLTGGLSYGRNTQKDIFATNVGVMNTGTSTRTNLDGKVITTHGDLKLTNQSFHELTLTAGLKYDQRKNNTASDTYNYNHIGVGNYVGINAPYSNRKTQGELAADYRLTHFQKLRLAYEHENIKRWCENIASGSQCVASPTSKEDKLGLTYKLKATDDLSVSTGYSYAKKKADFDHNFVANIGTTPVVGGSTTGQVYSQINAGDFFGFTAFPYASRKEHLVKAGANWQALEKLDLALNARYSKDNYDTTLGVQNANSKGANLDSTYSFNDQNSVTLYVDWQTGYRDLSDGTTSTSAPKSDGSITSAPTAVWSNRLKDESRAIGLITNHRGFLGGKMEINGDLSYSLDKSTYSTVVPYSVSTTVACDDPTKLMCGTLPDIKSSLVTFKLSDSYQLDTNSKVALGYTYQHRVVQDYVYNIYQAGYTPATLMPTNEQAPSYNVSMVTVSYNYTF